MRHSNLDETNKEIKNLLKIKDGWNGTDSKEIHYDYVLDALNIVSMISQKFNKLPNFISPTVYSGVVIEYNYTNKSRLDIRIGDSLDGVFINNFVNGSLVDKRVELSELDRIWRD